MTKSKKFYQSDVFEIAEDFFNEVAQEAREPRPLGSAPAKVSAQQIRGAIAAAAISFMVLCNPVASTMDLRYSVKYQAEAAVQVPRLSVEQARAASLMKAVMHPVPDRDEADGEDPDYGF